MSKQKNGGQKKGKGKTPKHSPSDAQQRLRTAENRGRRREREENRHAKKQTKEIRTAEQHRNAFYAKQRAAFSVNPTAVFPNADPRIARLIATWKAHRSMKGKGHA